MCVCVCVLTYGDLPFAGIVTDMASIFEEHYICRSSRQLSSEPFCSAQCVYIQEENTFLFQKVPVGQSVTAHFKLSNNSKVSCALALAIRNASAKVRRRPRRGRHGRSSFSALSRGYRRGRRPKRFLS